MDDSGLRSSPVTPLLAQALQESQVLGFLGSRPIDEVIEHARSFVDAILAATDAGAASIGPSRGLSRLDDGAPPFAEPNPLTRTLAVLDLGAGGGVPGLVVAHDLPGARVTLLDRRRTRTDFLERIVHRLRWTDRVDVLTQDAARPTAGQRLSFDVAVARGFGPPTETLQIAVRWVRSGGVIVISEPPTGDRWDGVDLGAMGVTRCKSPAQVSIFRTR